MGGFQTVNRSNQVGVPNVDNTDNNVVRDVVGNKNDTAAGTSIVSLLKSLGGGLSPAIPIVETTGTFSFDETSALEQTVFTIAIAQRTQIGAIWLDFVNLTQDTTIRVYHQIDGSNYREFQQNPWTTVDNDGVLIDGFTAYRSIRVTMQCGGGGAGSVDVPYSVV